MTKPPGVMGIEVAILDDTASITEQDDEDGERYKKNMKGVERAKRKHIQDSSNRKIALNVNTKVVHMHSILAMDCPGCRHAGWFHSKQKCQVCS